MNRRNELFMPKPGNDMRSGKPMQMRNRKIKHKAARAVAKQFGPAISPAHAKNVRRLNLWIELNVISAATPCVGRVAQQILHLINVALHWPELIDRHINE